MSFNFNSQKLCSESKLAILDPSDEERLTCLEDSLDETIMPVAVSLLLIDCLGLFGCDAKLFHG